MDLIDDMLETLDERIGNNYFLNKVFLMKYFLLMKNLETK